MMKLAISRLSRGPRRHFPCLMALVLLVCLFVPGTAFSKADTPHLILVNERPHQKIGNYMEILIDKDKNLSIASVAAAPTSGRFKPSDADVPNLGIIEAAVWARFTLYNPMDGPQVRYISFDFPLADHVQFFSPRESGFACIEAGHAVKRSEELIPNRYYVFPVTLGADETKTFYLRVASGANMVLPVTLWDPAALDRKDRADQMIFGIIYGILIAFIAYFTALTIKLKNPAVVWFTFYIVCLGMLLSCYQGYFQSLLSPAFADFNKIVLISTIGCLYFTGAKFFRVFLNISFYSRRIDRVLWILQWMGLGFIPMNLFPNPFTPLYGILLIGIGPIFSTSVSIFLWIKGVPNAKYFVIGWIIGHITSEIDLLRAIGLIPWMAGSVYLIPATMISTIIFFSIAILEQTRMYLEHANQDGLTGIANRRRFDEMMAIEWNRQLRNQRPLSVLLVDIDDFKAFNDTYGHLQGDACLQSVGEILAKTMRRAGDLAARYGGEEFVALLPETDAPRALQLAEMIRQKIEGCAIPHKASRAAEVVTVSIGTGTMIPDPKRSFSELIDRADKALYKAKNSGRNRVLADSSP